jgi:hypothetical protein
VNEELDRDIAEAIRQSLQEESASLTYAGYAANNTLSVPIKFYKAVSPSSSPPTEIESNHRQVVDDVEFALRLSLADEQNRDARISSFMEDEFPALGSVSSSPWGGKARKGRQGCHI